MSYKKITSILPFSRKGKKSKQKLEQEDLDVQRRSHLVKNYVPNIDSSTYDPNASVLEEYYKDKAGRAIGGSDYQQSDMRRLDDQKMYISNYQSVHAQDLKREEDDDDEKNDLFDDFRQDMMDHFDTMDEEGNQYPRIQERARGFNDELILEGISLGRDFDQNSQDQEIKVILAHGQEENKENRQAFIEKKENSEEEKGSIYEEEKDTVLPLYGGRERSGFERLKQDIGRHQSANVEPTINQRGFEEEKDIEKRIEMISGQGPRTPAKDDSRLRAPSVIQLDRQELKRKRVPNEQIDEEQQKVLEQQKDEAINLVEQKLKDKDLKEQKKQLEEYLKELEAVDEEDKKAEKNKAAVVEREIQDDNLISKDSDEGIDFLNEFYTEMNYEDEKLFKEKDEENQVPDFDFGKDTVDIIRFIDFNERRHQLEAQKYLKSNSSLEFFRDPKENAKQHVLTNEEPLSMINDSMKTEFNMSFNKPTVVEVTEDLILIGTSQGEVWMYDARSQQIYQRFIEKGKEFHNNPVTAIASHPVKPDYILVGYKQGQIILFDVTDCQKSVKVIRDHHRGVPVTNLSFCEFQEQKHKWASTYDKISRNQSEEKVQMEYNPYAVDEKEEMDKQRHYEAMNEWLFISIDFDGKVVINHVFKFMMFFRAKEFVIINPLQERSVFQSLACRFRDPLHPQFKLNDFVTLIAIGNSDKVLILAITQEKSQLIKQIDRPSYRVGNSEELKPLEDCWPSLSWGYGHSPQLKDKCYATLAVGWGPIIQLFVLYDILDDQKDFFIQEGYFVLPSPTEVTSRLSREGSVTLAAPFSSGKHVEINPYEQEERYKAIRDSLSVRKSSTNLTKCSFELKDLFIEKIWYLSESILLVLTRSLELKVLYTQKLNYGKYDPSKLPEDQPTPNQKQDNNPTIVDQGIILQSLTYCESGLHYQQTIKVQNGEVVALGIKGLSKLRQLRWDESLEHFREISRGNWIQEFARAIEIYTGKIKGFKDVPEDQYLRQETMKAELKLFISNVVTEQLEKWSAEKQADKHAQINQRKQANPYAQPGQLDDSNEDADILAELENQNREDGKKQRYNNLIRIAIEFCVIIQDCYFLFYDLFLLFQEDQLEEIFLDELKPFIMAGRFQNWELPNEILQNHIINYYKDPNRPEQIEKIIINLCLNDCPEEEIVNLIYFAEQNFLSTAMVYLHTAAYAKVEGSSCIHVILSLLELYKQAKASNPGSLEQMKQISQISEDAIERIQTEKSQFYLGYKILWVIRLILNGKRFPQGNIPEQQWRHHVHEIVNCMTTKNIMLDLLYIDAEAYFQIVSLLFHRGKVFEFIANDKLQQTIILKAQTKQYENMIIPDEMYEDNHQKMLSHLEILDRFEDVLMSNDSKLLVPNEMRLQYLFFVANVASKSSIEKDNKYYLKIMKELLTQSNKFLKFNQGLMKRARQKKMRGVEMSPTTKMRDENKDIYISENALMELLDLCEPLNDEEVDTLFQMAKSTKFNQLKVMLLEKKDDIVQCLQLFIEGMKMNSYAATRKEAINRIFDWINLKLDQFNAKKVGPNQESSNKEDALRAQIMAEFSELVNLDAQQTFLLIDEKFNHEHEKFVKSLIETGSTEQQFKYLETMLSTHHQKIQTCVEEYLVRNVDKEKALTYMNLQNMHLKLLCQNYPNRVLQRVRRINKNEVHLSTDDCLEICQQYDMVEACAIFLYKIGNYFQAATKYMLLLTDKKLFNYPKLIKQLERSTEKGNQIPHFIPFLSKDNKNTKKMILRAMESESQKYPEDAGFSEEDWASCLVVRFDFVIRKVIGAIIKESTENFNEETINTTWFFTLDSMFKIKNQQLSILEKLKESKIETLKKASLLLSEADQVQEIEAINSKFNSYNSNLEMFFRSRIAYIIEQTLKHIELSEFLDHMVNKDHEILFKELRDMIVTIFSETSIENQVLMNANRSANQLSIASFDNIGQDVSMGLPFQYRRCLICRRFLDEVQKKNPASRKNSYQFDSDDDMEQPYIDPFEDKLTLYDCGHAFHIKCVEKHFEQEIREKNQKAVSAKAKNFKQDVHKMFETQPCPHCFSEKFRIDFDTVLNRRNQISKGVARNVMEQSTQEESKSSRSSSSDSMHFDTRKMNKLEQRREMRATSVAKFTKSVQEQRMQHFDFNQQNEAVMIDHFKYIM